MILALKFRSSVHFEWVFFIWCKIRINLILSHVTIQFSQYKTSSFNGLGTFVENHLTIDWWSFTFGFSILYHWSINLSSYQYHCLDYYNFVIRLKIRKREVSKFFPQGCFGNFGSLEISYECLEGVFLFLQKTNDKLSLGFWQWMLLNLKLLLADLCSYKWFWKRYAVPYWLWKMHNCDIAFQCSVLFCSLQILS